MLWREHGDHDPGAVRGAFWGDPYPVYAALRAHAPVHEVMLSGGPAWLVSRYEDVRAALTDPRFSKDWLRALPP